MTTFDYAKSELELSGNTPPKKDQSLRFFICSHCASLATSENIDKEIKSGGIGLCDCEYMKFEWDYGTQSFEPIYYRVYHERIEITEDLFLKFREESNCVKRLEMFDSVLE
jgi:hypothetical protein